MTGVPPSSQRLRLKTPGRQDQWLDGDDTVVGQWGLMRGCEIQVCPSLSSAGQTWENPTLIDWTGT